MKKLKFIDILLITFIVLVTGLVIWGYVVTGYRPKIPLYNMYL